MNLQDIKKQNMAKKNIKTMAPKEEIKTEEVVEIKEVVKVEEVVKVVIKPKKIKKTKVVDSSDEADVIKPKRTRKPSIYNIKLGEFMKILALEEGEKNKEDRMPKGGRMKRAQEMYKEWKANTLIEA